jgi:putative exporter of polyketide antibiotics
MARYLPIRYQHRLLVQPVSETQAFWGNFLYQLAAAITAFILLIIAANFVTGMREGDPVLDVAPLLLAGAIWLAGLGCRYLMPNL